MVNSPVSLAPVPDWVNHVPIPEIKMESSSLHSHRLLLERQSDIVSSSVFFRTVTRVLDEAGVQELSSLDIEYEGASEGVALHRIQIYREGMPPIDRINLDYLRVYDIELQARSGVYTGMKCAHLPVAGVRVGDVVEVCFSVNSKNDVWSGKHTQSFPLKLNYPVERILARVRVPSSEPLLVQSDVSPDITSDGSWKYFEWQMDHVGAGALEPNQPEWFDPWQHVTITQFESWNEVAEVCAPFYELPNMKMPYVCKTASQWLHLPKKKAITEALRFVQDNIAYEGIEDGALAFKPTPPEEVLNRGFTDCKGKSLLLRALLQELGVEAEPCLVNTVLGSRVIYQPPSPMAFNHVIVRARLDGCTYWLDPTPCLQGGSLDRMIPPRYGHALVLSPGESDLTEIREKPEPRSELTYHYIVNSDETVHLKISAQFKGSNANLWRHHLIGIGKDGFTRERNEFLERLYGNVKVISEPELMDDIERNVVSVAESYLLENPWSAINRNSQEIDIFPQYIISYIDDDIDLSRTTPLAKIHPEHVRETILIDLPSETWSIQRNSSNVHHAAFDFQFESQ